MADDDIGGLFKSGSLVFIGFSVETFFTYLTTILLARLLGPEIFGVIELAHTLLIFLATVCLLGIDKGLARFLSRSDINMKDYLQVGFPPLFLSVLTAILVYILSDEVVALLFDNEYTLIIIIFSIMLPAYVLVKISEGIFRGFTNTHYRVISKSITIPTIRLLGVIVLMYTISNAIFASTVYVLSYVVGAIISVFFVWKLINENLNAELEFKRGPFKEIAKFSIPLVVAGLMYSILSWVDIFLLQIILNDSSIVGVYRAVYPTAKMLLLVLLSFNYLIMPLMSSADSQDDREQIRRLFKKTTKFITILSLPVFLNLLFFSREIVSFVFGPEYISGSIVLSILSVGFIIQAISGPNGNLLQSIGDTRAVMIANILAVMVNLTANIALIPEYGILGAGAATTISFCILNLTMFYIIYFKFNINTYSLNQFYILSAAVVVFSLSITLSTWSHHLTKVVITNCIFVPAYSLIIWRWFISPNDLEIVKSALK